MRQLLPTSELPTDVILKQTVFAVGMYVKFPEEPLVADWLGGGFDREAPLES